MPFECIATRPLIAMVCTRYVTGKEAIEWHAVGGGARLRLACDRLQRRIGIITGLVARPPAYFENST
jgi:hypothetical protein